MSVTIDLAARLGASERTLRRAVDRGLLRAARPTPNRLRLEDGEFVWLVGHWALVSRLMAALRTEPNVSLAVLFGSRSRGDETERSDVDVLVDLRRDDLYAVGALEARLTAAIGRPVEILRLSRVRHDPEFLLEAIVDGRVLVDRERQWPTLRRSHARVARAADKQAQLRRQAIDRDLEEALG